MNNDLNYPNLTVRKGKERGQSNTDWLKSYHSFSFADYHDIKHMGYGHLRVINDDVVAPSSGFGMHGHRDMEIITVVLSGALQHQDSIGNGTVILPGEIQRMSAGKGIYHSEINPSATEAVRLLQIWIYPNAQGLTPSYEQKKIDSAAMHNTFCLIAAPKDGVISLHQNLWLYRAQIEAGKTASFVVHKGEQVWAQIAEGEIEVDGTLFETGDAYATVLRPETGGQETVIINHHAKRNSDVLIFTQQV